MTIQRGSSDADDTDPPGRKWFGQEKDRRLIEFLLVHACFVALGLLITFCITFVQQQQFYSFPMVNELHPLVNAPKAELYHNINESQKLQIPEIQNENDDTANSSSNSFSLVKNRDFSDGEACSDFVTVDNNTCV